MTILSLFPSGLKSLLLEVEGLGISLCLVGGGIRDFLLHHTLSSDLDFEVRGEGVPSLGPFLKGKGLKVRELPYQILKVEFVGYDLEFSTPRREVPIAGNKSHHHFQAELDTLLAYEKAFLRRDFTVNAIGMELDFKQGTEKILDFFGGQKDLEKKVLKNITEDFFLDSVRFLRLVRFVTKYSFALDPKLANELGKFDLEELSVYHFREEAAKSGKRGSFINHFNHLVKQYGLALPAAFQFLGQLNFKESDQSLESLLARSVMEGRDPKGELADFFGLPKKRLLDCKNFYLAYQEFQKISVQDYKILVNKEKKEALKDPLLKILKTLDEKKEWAEAFCVKGPMDFSHIEITPLELEETAPESRSFLKYYKKIKNDY